MLFALGALSFDITGLRTWYFRTTTRMVGLKVIVRGHQSDASPQLVVANHASYFDVLVLGGVARGTFVAKVDIRSWPMFGWLGASGGTIFVDRKRAATGGARDQLRQRLDAGDNLLMFPESTSTDGNRVRPFKSALFNVAEGLGCNGKPVAVQPVSIAYTRLNGLPIGVGWRPFFAWYGDMDLMPHLWKALQLGTVTVEVTFHPAVSAAEFSTRKQLAKHCEHVTGAGVARLLTGRHAA
jgi:1-acyl-sn-glycerol-3-phosphate acyltransferase